MRITSDSGINWGPELNVADGHYIADPNLKFVGDTLWAAWTDRGFSSYPEIGFTKSTDRGNSWQNIQRLTQTTYQAVTPWLAYSNGKVYVVWEEDTHLPDNMDIYYKYWSADIGINDETMPSISESPAAYPNPFNSTAKITFSDNQGGEIEIFDISGRLIKSLPVKDKSEGSVIWDAKDGLGQPLASGIYIAKAKTTRGVCTAKLVHLK